MADRFVLCLALWLVGGASCTHLDRSADTDLGSRLRAPGIAPGQAAGCDELARAAPGAAFVLLDTATNHWLGCNPEGASTPYLPASTFKVPHALIALATGVVTDPDALVPWDGVQRRVASWNRDTSLASGLHNSTIWFYQGTARAIGHRRMARWVRQLNYGNASIGSADDLTSFWLTGTLRISAIEQVIFLDQLRRAALPGKIAHQQRVASMMAQDSETADATQPATLFAKSGAAIPVVPATGDLARTDTLSEGLGGALPVGWYVGWVARPAAAGGDQVFAFNLPLSSYADLAKRAPLAHALLKANTNQTTSPAAWPDAQAH